jgi:hypothetical protein
MSLPRLKSTVKNSLATVWLTCAATVEKGRWWRKNVVLNDNTTERIASVRNDRDSTYWVVTHDYNSNVFRIYHATKTWIGRVGRFSVGRCAGHYLESRRVHEVFDGRQYRYAPFGGGRTRPAAKLGSNL